MRTHVLRCRCGLRDPGPEHRANEPLLCGERVVGFIERDDFDEPGGLLRLYRVQSADLRRAPSAELRVHLRGVETCLDCDMPPRACRCETVLRCSCGIPASACVCAG